MSENEIAKAVVDSAYKIHKLFGPGLLESVYETILAAELADRGFSITRQQGIPVVYNHRRLPVGFRADLIIENKVIIEVKSIDTLAEIHKKQLLTYLRLAEKRLGLLINFNVEILRGNIVRIINGYLE
jgi:GxxExxY protein